MCWEQQALGESLREPHPVSGGASVSTWSKESTQGGAGASPEPPHPGTSSVGRHQGAPTKGPRGRVSLGSWAMVRRVPRMRRATQSWVGASQVTAEEKTEPGQGPD